MTKLDRSDDEIIRSKLFLSQTLLVTSKTSEILRRRDVKKYKKKTTARLSLLQPEQQIDEAIYSRDIGDYKLSESVQTAQ